MAERLDFSTLRNLPKEVFKNVPDGSVREVDFAAKVDTRSGEPEFVLIHVEVQARPENDFARRMFEYASLLWLGYQAPVFPVVRYLKGGEGLIHEEYRLRVFDDEVFRFRYASVALARLDAREYVRKGALGAALAALMQRAKVEDPLRLRADMLREVAKSKLDEARKLLLVDVIETYFELSRQERRRFQSLVARKEYRKVQEVELTWAERLREEGLIEGKRDALLRFLTSRFGAPSKEQTAKVMEITSVAELDALLERAATAESIEDVGI